MTPGQAGTYLWPSACIRRRMHLEPSGQAWCIIHDDIVSLCYQRPVALSLSLSHISYLSHRFLFDPIPHYISFLIVSLSMFISATSPLFYHFPHLLSLSSIQLRNGAVKLQAMYRCMSIRKVKVPFMETLKMIFRSHIFE